MTSRHINGKLFDDAGAHAKKSIAQKEADRLRGQGKCARVIKEGGVLPYVVYASARGSRRR